MDETEFRSPSIAYRSAPFWAWNDLLDPEELVRQISQFHRQGLGGFFMHSRDGLETPYLGAQWNHCIQVCVAEAKRLGMHAWLYDEDRFPSGTCSGTVTAFEGGIHALKGLTMEVVQAVPSAGALRNDDVRALYVARVDGDEIETCHQVEALPDKLPSQTVVLVVRFEISRGSAWFNGSAPPDNLSPECVQAFIESTHEKYYRLLGHDIGTTVPGIFTDEPSLADRHAAFNPSRSWIPWSHGMEQFYRNLGFGNIYDTLPYIFFNGDRSAKARHDYWRCIALRYEQTYSQQIGQWCRNHGMIFTGHYLQEDKMGLCVRVNGSIMPHYVHEQIPGIDLLCERTDEYLTVKQCSSVAHQYGKSQVLSETYAACGWEFSFEGQKWIGDWQYALGVTNRCQHLSLYSLRGARKRDYPQSFNIHAAWWEKLHVVEDYFARISYMLRQGEVYRPVLVIHPVSTVWTRMGCSPYGNPIRRNERDVPAQDAYGFALNELLRTLNLNFIDVDLGDETLLLRDGNAHDAQLSIRNATYRTVVVPRMESMYRSTFELLRRFVRQGGRLLVQEPSPHMIEGVEDCEVIEFFSLPDIIHVEDDTQLLETLNVMEPPPVSFRSNDDSYHSSLISQLRRDDNLRIVFITNNDRFICCSGRLVFQFIGNVSLCDPMTGMLKPYPVDSIDSEEGTMEISVTFAPCESLLLSVDTAGEPVLRNTDFQNHTDKLFEFIFSQRTEIVQDMLNVLTLDSCLFSIDGKPLSDVPQFVYQGQHEIRRMLGMVPLDTDEVPQRYRWVSEGHPQDGHQVSQEFSFFVDAVPTTDCFLVMEEPEKVLITFNGRPVDNCPTGTYLDHAFKRISLPRFEKGENVLRVDCYYTQTMSLEDLYIVGDFGVSLERHVVSAVKTLVPGDWGQQGLLQYPGSVLYRYTFHLPKGATAAVLDIGAWEGTVASVICNDIEFDVPWTHMRKVDVSAVLRDGSNDLGIKIFGSPRNMLGPLHLKVGKKTFNNPAAFCPSAEELTQEYRFVPSGLLSPPVLSIFR